MKESKNPELKKLPVTKLDAARRQLETAITLWFHEADPVSIHTLTKPLTNCFMTSTRSWAAMTPDSPNIRPECRDEWRHILNRAQNFLKHANRDQTSTLFFEPRTTECSMLEACERASDAGALY